MDAAGMTEEKMKGGNMPLIFGLSFILSLLAALALSLIVIHQNGFLSLFYSDPDFGKAGSETMNVIENFKANYGTRHRSFGHGALHGAFTGGIMAGPACIGYQCAL